VTEPWAIYRLRLILAMIHICTKFELSSFSHSVDRMGSQIFNEGHVNRAMPPMEEFYILSVSTCQFAIIHLHTKFYLPNRINRNNALNAMAAGIV